jgi:hypothetical protein
LQKLENYDIAPLFFVKNFSEFVSSGKTSLKKNFIQKEKKGREKNYVIST